MPKPKSIANPKVISIQKKNVLDDFKEIKINIDSNTTKDKLYNAFFRKFEDKEVQMFVPTLFMAKCKENFYKNGGKETKAYTGKEYAVLMEIPEVVVDEFAEKNMSFFKWLHDSRDFKEEVNAIILIMVRELYNAFMSTSSARDKSQILATLSRFSSLTDPPKPADDFGKSVDELQTPEEVMAELAKLGYSKDDETTQVVETDIPELEVTEEVTEDTELPELTEGIGDTSESNEIEEEEPKDVWS